MFYLQIAAAVVGLLLGITQISRESQPLIQQIQQMRQTESQKKAQMIAGMGISWQYRGHDGTWKYYSDSTGQYWCRVNLQGIQEYSENPQFQMASNPTLVR